MIGATTSKPHLRTDVYMVTTRNNSWVFAVGNDFDNPAARTVGSGQSLVHQYLAPVGDTSWVQKQNAATPLAGTTVTINDTAPTNDRFNLSLCEVLPAAAGGGSGDVIAPAVSLTALLRRDRLGRGDNRGERVGQRPASAAQFQIDGVDLPGEVATPHPPSRGTRRRQPTVHTR